MTIFCEYKVIIKGKLPTIWLLNYLGWMLSSFLSYSEFLPFLTLLLASKSISASVHHFYLNEGIVTVTQNAFGKPNTLYRLCAVCSTLLFTSAISTTPDMFKRSHRRTCLLSDRVCLRAPCAPPPILTLPPHPTCSLARHWSQVFIPPSRSEGLTAAVPV